MSLDGVTIQPTSTVDAVTDELRHAITDGRLVPGEALREVALTESLGVSRGTVREALRSLVAEGLVQHRPNRGAVVAVPDPAEVAEIYRARTVLEAAGIERLTDDGWELVDRALGAMTDAADAGEVAAFVDAHADLHLAFVAPLGTRLAAVAAGLHRELRLSLAVLERLTGTMADSLTAHVALVDTLRHGDRRVATRALADHLAHGAEDVEELAGR